jgi:hypothetical protein
VTNFDRELMSSVRPYFEEHAKLTAALGVLRYSEEPVKAMAARQPGRSRAPSWRTACTIAAGSAARPANIIGYLKESRRAILVSSI